ncbi:MAG: glycosyltransferase family 4 protein [Candidatus Aminicenantia bacterium]
MQIHQFVTSLSYGDAISDEALEIQKILREEGYQSKIFAHFYHPKMAKFMIHHREYSKFSSPENIVIFHFSIGSPISKLFFRIPEKKILIYHNITPYYYFLDSHRILAKECYKGRLELKTFINKVDLALGDSEFNRQELEQAGYRKTGVLPIISNFSKFDIPGDQIVKEIFDRDRTTILFVGRLIPNKKYEELIKVFYLYQKYYNKNSQLILAGDYNGFERYFCTLNELIDRLKLNNVYFTGHIEFPELVAFYRLADIFLCLSEHEGFGVPLLESFYLKIPVIAYTAGAVEETMNSGGIILNKKNLDEIAALIDLIITDDKFRQKIIQSQLKALKKYSRENLRKILINHIKSIND